MGLNYKPMISYWESQKKTERQLTLIRLLYAITQEEALGVMSRLSCSEKGKASMATYLPFKP